MINDPYSVCWFHCFLSLIILAQALCPAPPPSPHPLSYHPLHCMWSFCLSSFATNAIFFSLNLTAQLLHTPPSTTVLLPLTIPLQLPLTWPIPPPLFPLSFPLPFLCFISSPLPSLCPLPFLISYPHLPFLLPLSLSTLF